MPQPDPIAFTIFGLEIRWYGILIAFAILLAAVILTKRAPGHGLTADSVLDILIFSIPIGILGARLYYVVFNWDYYGSNLLEILNFRGGGLAIHGGLIFGIATAYLVCRYKNILFLDALDMTVPVIALAQSIGRWGNYFNSEAHGGPTHLPWAITIMGEKVHPTFLYESIWCFLLFLFLIYIDNRRHFIGQVACLYGALYSAERFFVEGLRTDSLMIGSLRQAQVLSLAVIIICIALYFFLARKDLKAKDNRHTTEYKYHKRSK